MSNDKARARRLWNNFRLIPEEWDKILAFQRGVCCVCGRPERTGKRLSTDHSHLDGLIRGLLCSQCNPLTGKLENAFVRLGMHKVPGLTLIKIIEKLGSYLTNPPATQALGRQVFGFAGRCGTKRHRAALRKEKKAAQKANKVTKIPKKLVP